MWTKMKQRDLSRVIFFISDASSGFIFAYKTRWFLGGLFRCQQLVIVSWLGCVYAFPSSATQHWRHNHRQSARSKKIPKTILQSIILVTQKTEWFYDTFPNYAPHPPPRIIHFSKNRLYVYENICSYIYMYVCFTDQRILLNESKIEMSTRITLKKMKRKQWSEHFYDENTCAHLSHDRKIIFFSKQTGTQIRCRWDVENDGMVKLKMKNIRWKI